MMWVLLCAILVAPTHLTASASRAASPPPPPAFVPLSPRQGVYPVPPVPASFPYLPPGGGPLPVASAHSLTYHFRALIYPLMSTFTRRTACRRLSTKATVRVLCMCLWAAQR